MSAVEPTKPFWRVSNAPPPPKPTFAPREDLLASGTLSRAMALRYLGRAAEMLRSEEAIAYLAHVAAQQGMRASTQQCVAR